MNDNILKIKKHVKITDYIEPGKLIKTSDKNWKCLSPFSSEKTPSFYIKEEPSGIQKFKCFSTGIAGDIISFLMELENKTFPEVIQELSDKIGIVNEYSKIKISQKKYIDILNKVNNKLKFLLDQSQPAKDYLINTRKLTEETIDLFKIGYSNDSILAFLIANNLDLGLSKELGIIGESNSNYYNVINNRITIPLFSKESNIIGITNRRFLETDTYPKYVNPPNNTLYKKNNYIFNLNFSSEYIKKADSVIIVEGHFDFIKLFQSGFKNSACILGTMLYSGQIKELAKLTENFYICLDSDPAGKRAIIKNTKEIIKQGYNIFIIELEQGEDPDSFIDNYGAKEFQKKINNAKNFLEYINSQNEDMIELLEDLSEIIPKINSTVKQQYWYQNIKKYTGIDISKNIKKEYFEKVKSKPLSETDLIFLRLFINSNDEQKSYIINNLRTETENGKLLYLKLKNTNYNISLTDEENETIKLLKSKTLFTKEKIEKMIKQHNEKIKIASCLKKQEN